MKKDKLEYLVVTGKIVGKRAHGRRMLFTDKLIKWKNCDNFLNFLERHQKENLLLPMSFYTALKYEEDHLNTFQSVLGNDRMFFTMECLFS